MKHFYTLYYKETAKSGKQGTENSEHLDDLIKHYNMYENAYMIKETFSNDDGYKENVVRQKTAWKNANSLKPSITDTYMVLSHEKKLCFTTVEMRMYDPEDGGWILKNKDEEIYAWKEIEEVADGYKDPEEFNQ